MREVEFWLEVLDKCLFLCLQVLWRDVVLENRWYVVMVVLV